MKYHIAKAHDLGDQVTPDTGINIGPEVPPEVTRTNYESIYRDFYDVQARMLMSAFQSLPGGTWDRLFALMCEKKASLLRVPLFERAPTQRPLRTSNATICPECGKECHITKDGAIVPHRPPFGKFQDCEGKPLIVDEVTKRMGTVSRMLDFPLVIQTVLFAGEQKKGIQFSEADTKALATEICKLLERES